MLFKSGTRVIFIRINKKHVLLIMNQLTFYSNNKAIIAHIFTIKIKEENINIYCEIQLEKATRFGIKFSRIVINNDYI